eukprot:3273147-Rhodomonas_salina.1
MSLYHRTTRQYHRFRSIIQLVSTTASVADSALKSVTAYAMSVPRSTSVAHAPEPTTAVLRVP